MQAYALSTLVLLLVLTACEGSHRPVYSGQEESTEGVPGFVKGRKVSPHVKLGQSYSVDGEEYVPRYQRDYVEEGLASWYGPGFHGGKTANGEEYDKHDLTAAHRTLPLPSIVKVTMLETGKSAYVRINDRGPFSKGRIIDLSHGAADAIGLIGKGVATVRVEYMPTETERFTSLLAQGRSPRSIDIASEVIGKSPTIVASNDSPVTSVKTKTVAAKKAGASSYASRISLISSAQAQPIEYDDETNDAADVGEVSSADLAPPVARTPAPSPVNPRVLPSNTKSPFAVIDPADQAALESRSAAPVEEKASAAPEAEDAFFYQLGAFKNQANAESLRKKVSAIGTTHLDTKTVEGSGLMYVVRMGPYTSVDESDLALAKLEELGVNPKRVSP